MLSTVVAGCGGAEAISDPRTDPAGTLGQSCPGALTLRPSYRARQGQRLQGLTGPSFVVTGARFGCQQVSALDLSGSTLSGQLDGNQITGSDLVGVDLSFRDVAGAVGEVAVTGVAPDPMDASGETLLYSLVTLDPATGQPKPVCAPDLQGLSAAIAMRGSFDPSGAPANDGNITFACTSGVIAKCVRWGYKPWKSVNGVSLRDYHLACTRMARADYCGDGQTHTLEGTQIDLYDNLGYLTPDPGLLDLFEATWTTQGAYCIARERWLSLQNLLPDSCKAKFVLSVEPSPVLPLDLCFARRLDVAASTALLSDRTGLNITLGL